MIIQLIFMEETLRLASRSKFILRHLKYSRFAGGVVFGAGVVAAAEVTFRINSYGKKIWVYKERNKTLKEDYVKCK